MADRLHLERRHRETLEALLQEHLPDAEVWAYGSRVSGKSHDGSDLDLVLRGLDLREIPLCRLGDFEEAVRRSNIPFLVEARDWARLPERFHRNIERDYVVLRDSTAGCVGGGSGDWRDMPFSEAVEVNPAVRLERGTMYPFVDMAAVDAGSRSVDAVEQRAYSGGGSRFQSGDTLMARITPCLENGKVARYRATRPPSAAHGSTEFIVIRGRAGVTDSEFAYYLTQWEVVRSYAIDQMTGTSGRQRVPTDSLNHLAIPVPSLPEQRAIARILGALDDRIELNRRMNETLEATARALFKSWFVDFDPVRAKMEGRDTGLPRRVADLFPDRLVASELGEIPEGWINYCLNDLAEHHTRSLTPSGHPETNFEHFSIPAYDKDRMPSIDRGDSIKSNKTVVPSGAVLLSKLNPEIPRVWMPGIGNGSLQLCSTEFLVFTARQCANRGLLFCLFTSAAFRETLQSMVTGTSRSHQRVPPAALKQCEILSGTPPLFSEFGKIAGTMLNQAVGKVAGAQVFAQIRDTLLPKLVSGEIDTKGLYEPTAEATDKARRATGGAL